MKFSVAFIAAVTAEWNGQSPDMLCGGQYSAPVGFSSMVNSTCTVTGTSIDSIQVGNGAFITGTNTFTGFDGISGNADSVVIFFEQKQNADGTMDNSTCWDAAISCVDNGAASSGLFFMDTGVSGQAGNSYNLQIAGVEGGKVNTLSFNLGSAVNNITSTFGSITAPENDVWGNKHSSTGLFTIDVQADEVFGQLFQLSVVDVNGDLDLFKATVTN